MNDDLIIQKFITDKNKINSHYKQIINKDQQVKEYLDNRYKDGNNDYCETIYRIQYHLDNHPICPNCGKYVKFTSGYGFREFCSTSCSKNYIKESYDNAITDDLIKNDYLIDNKINTNKLQIKYIKEHGYESYLLNRYNDSVNNMNSYSIQCNCGCKGSCIKYGKYKRIIDKYEIFIQRVLCKVCKITHAILPTFIVPQERMPLDYNSIALWLNIFYNIATRRQLVCKQFQ